ncbi:hypothetical protein [Sphingomonas sp.]|jgi:hypothetical protein|uniref:hypothetical protein n=1 Tax=Sphingomonas sp. TaxID=28214 RepID=UPI0035C7DA5A
MNVITRPHIASLAFAASSLLGGCERRDAVDPTAANGSAPIATAPVARGVDAPAEPAAAK